MRGKKILNHDTVSSAQYLGGRVILPIQGLKQFHNATAKNKNTLMIFTCNYVDLKNVQYRSLAIVMTETDPKQADVYIFFSLQSSSHRSLTSLFLPLISGKLASVTFLGHGKTSSTVSPVTL